MKQYVRILLVSPRWSQVYDSYKKAAKNLVLYPPLGLCYIATPLHAQGHDVKVIDMELLDMSDQEIVNFAKEFKPDIIGLSSGSTNFELAVQLARKLSSQDRTVVLGGTHISVLPEKGLDRAFDFGVVGEAEQAFPKLVSQLSNGGDASNIPGVINHTSSGGSCAAKRSYIKNLDGLGFPLREALVSDSYFKGVYKRGRKKFTTIAATRGCPFNCIFCSRRKIMGSEPRHRSPENIYDEMVHCKEHHEIEHFVFLDDTLTLNREKMMNLSEIIYSNELDVTWQGWTRADMVDEELLTKMKRAGFVKVSFGIESGNQEMLNRIKKFLKIEDIKKAYSLCKKLGIPARGSAILGHPGETRETAMQTINLIKGLEGCVQIYLGINTPYPGSELYDMARRGDGVHLLSNELSEFSKWGKSVLRTDELSREDLVELQKRGTREFYMNPRRMFYNLISEGLTTGISNALSFLNVVL